MALENLTGHKMAFNGFESIARKRGAEAWRTWLKNHPWSAVEESLTQQLDGDDPAAVQKAIEALGHTGGDAARAALRSYLKANHETAGLLELLACERALGHLKDTAAVPLLADVLRQNIGPAKKRARKLHELGWIQRPVHLAAAAAEALGWTATPEAEQVLLDVFPKLRHFWDYTFRTGDHSWLMGCHSSPIHWRIIEAFDAMGTRLPEGLVPHVLRSVPLDTDRGLLVTVDAYETVAGRVVQRSGHLPAVLETCLAVLGDPKAKLVESLKAGVTASPPASSTKPLKPQPRAAQILSACALDPRIAPRVAEAFNRFRAAKPSRERSWTLFFLARALGRLGNAEVVPSLMAALSEDPREAELGYVDPPNVFIYSSMFPFYRASAAYALGAIGDPRGIPVLLDTVGDFANAMDVRRSAAQGLGLAARRGDEPKLRQVAEDYPEIITRRTLLRAAKAAASR
jgi:HEAT repeat protein